jgi:hypothetical protein
MNDAAIDFVTKKVAALETIQQNLKDILASTTDLEVADDLRGDLSSVNMQLFALKTALNNLKASQTPVPPPSDAQIQSLTDALRQLDGFVREDAQIQVSLNLLTQLATAIGQA